MQGLAISGPRRGGHGGLRPECGGVAGQGALEPAGPHPGLWELTGPLASLMALRRQMLPF